MKTEKLPFKVQLCYGIGEISKNWIIYVHNMFLLFFYTDIVKIPPIAATIIMLISRFWAIVTDPTMGAILDNTRNTTVGKCRFFFRNFSIPAGVSIFLCFFVPELADMGKIFWVAIMFVISSTLLATLQVPMNTFPARLTQSQFERAKLMQFKVYLTKIPSTLIPAATLPAVALFGQGNDRKGFAVYGAVTAIIFTAGYLIAYWGTKGYEPLDTEEKASKTAVKGKKIGFKEMVKGVASNKYCLLLLICFIFFLMYANLEGAALVYYCRYVLKDTNVLAPRSTIELVVGLVGTLFMAVVVKRFGNAMTCFMGVVVGVGSWLIRGLLGDPVWAFLGIGAVGGLGLTFFSSLINQCMMDAIVYGEWKTGVKLEGLTMSAISVGQKIGAAIGGTIAPALLTLVAYNPDLTEQPKEVLSLFTAEMIWIPMALYIIVAAIFLYIMKLEKQLPQMRAEIEARNHGQEPEA